LRQSRTPYTLTNGPKSGGHFTPYGAATDADIDAIIAEFGGDYRAAIRALFHDLTQLALDSEAALSKGFVRGRLMPFRIRETS
jgi:hypothetical protein